MLKQPESPDAFGINGVGGLCEYASSLICFFWFESSYCLHHLTTSTKSMAFEAIRDFQMESYNSIPTAAFTQWVRTLLNTTHLSTNVVVLALLFVYRLKVMNPLVQGKRGSEYRLLTVAFMLSNKFLDDNTYTNKTWAQVTRIDVKEIHVMEVEFLSNMRYTMFTNKRQWLEWQELIRNFASLAIIAKRNMHTRAIQSHTYSLPSPPWSVPDSPSLLQEVTDMPGSRKRRIEDHMNGGISKRKHPSIEFGMPFVPAQSVQPSYHQAKSLRSMAFENTSIGLLSPVPYTSIAPTAYNFFASQTVQSEQMPRRVSKSVCRDSPYAPVKAVSALREPVSPLSRFDRPTHARQDPQNLEYETIGHSRNIRQGVAGAYGCADQPIDLTASLMPVSAPMTSVLSATPPPLSPYPLQKYNPDLSWPWPDDLPIYSLHSGQGRE